MPISYIADHEVQALALLLSQYKDRPRLAAVLTSYIKQCQALEDASNDVLVKRAVSDAVGEQLDAIGRIVGQVRDGLSDATFRLFILARIRIHLSHGHGDDIIDVLSLVEAATFALREFFPATVFVDYATPVAADPFVLAELARTTKAAGVRLQLLYGDYNIGVDGFSFVAGAVDTVSTTEGSSLTGESTGGYLSGAIE